MYIVQIHKYYISKTYYMYNISYIDINNTNYTILIHDTYIYIIVNLYHLLYPTFGGPKLKTTRNGTVTTNISHSIPMNHSLSRKWENWRMPMAGWVCFFSDFREIHRKKPCAMVGQWVPSDHLLQTAIEHGDL